MSARPNDSPRHVPHEDTDPLSAFTPEQREQLRALWERERERPDRIWLAIYRACITVAREIRPGKRWEGL